MGTLLFGMESEFAVSQGKAVRGRDSNSSPAAHLLRLASKRIPNLRGRGDSGVFLVNGARFYVDTGAHPEMSGPEVANPWDVVRYQLAGEHIITKLATELAATVPTLKNLRVFKNNVDHVQGSTWGTHESFCFRGDRKNFLSQLTSHLVSRTIYTGAGGLNPKFLGIEFVMSPRAWFIEVVSSHHSTESRPLVHTKEQSLAGQEFERLHLICGDNASSERATWLKMGTTALLVAMIDAGLTPSANVRVRRLLDAFRIFARDTSLKVQVGLSPGGRASALEIQRALLEQVESHQTDEFMPPWAPEVCRVWRQTLDSLEHAPRQVANALDWTIKQAVFEDHLCTLDFRPERVQQFNKIAIALEKSLTREELWNSNMPTQMLLGSWSELSTSTITGMNSVLRAHGVTLDEFKAFFKAKAQIVELDQRFSMLGEEGFFGILDRAGVLNHHIDGVDNIEHACENPPLQTRAQVRGEAIRQHAFDPAYSCDWAAVLSPDGKFLDLSDPFTVETKWVKIDDLPRRRRMHMIRGVDIENLFSRRLVDRLRAESQSDVVE